MVVGRIMTPPNGVHILIPATCEHDVFHCIEDKIRLPYKEKILDYPDGPNVITRVLKSKKGRRENQRKRCVVMEAGSENAVWLTLMMKEGDPKAKNAGGL